jgi:protein-S-isoprenylcysteine O-methyltransferase Ste14
MFTIILQLLGWITFIVASIILGAWLRKHPSKKGAERTSRILHFLFWVGVAPPVGFGFFYPGLTHFDSAIGLQSLPQSSTLQLLGTTVFLIGAGFILASNITLWILGSGANAFLLTKRLVAGGIYQWARNPMSLGFYLVAIGIGLLVESIFLTVGALLLFIPSHIFYLKYFEEYELGLRLGQSYVEYKKRVLFLLPRFNFRQKTGENHK